MDENYLEHHGIKGQKWGIRRYQNQDGSLTVEGRKRRGLPENDRAAKKQAKKEKAEAKKAEAAAQQHENLKQYVRKHPSKLYRHRTEFSSKEIDEIVKDIQTDRKLKDIRKEEVQRGWDKVNTIANNVGKVANLIDSGKRVYNATAEINNLLVDNGTFKSGKKMLKIGEKPEEKKDTTFDDKLKAGDWKYLYDNRNLWDNSQLVAINKRFTQEDLLEKNMGGGYVGKHLKHCLELTVGDIVTDDHLEHHGILGQKWGIRRFQNKDGSLTEEGKMRYKIDANKEQPKIHDIFEKAKYNEDVSDAVFKELGADKNI